MGAGNGVRMAKLGPIVRLSNEPVPSVRHDAVHDKDSRLVFTELILPLLQPQAAAAAVERAGDFGLDLVTMEPVPKGVHETNLECLVVLQEGPHQVCLVP